MKWNFSLPSTPKMRPDRYQSVAQKPEEDGESVESEDPYATISALGLRYRRQQRIIVAQWVVLAVLLLAIGGLFWKGQIMQGRCPYQSIDRQLPDHIYCVYNRSCFNNNSVNNFYSTGREGGSIQEYYLHA